MTLNSGDVIYLDSNVFIYATETNLPNTRGLARLFDSFLKGAYTAVTSELTLAEVLVKPLRDNNQRLITIYKEIISESGYIKVLPVGRPILERSALMRSVNTRLRLPDAVHLASALLTKSAYVLTNDFRMAQDAKGFGLAPISFEDL